MVPLLLPLLLLSDTSRDHNEPIQVSDGTVSFESYADHETRSASFHVGDTPIGGVRRDGCLRTGVGCEEGRRFKPTEGPEDVVLGNGLFA